VTTASLSIVYDQPIAMTPTTARVGLPNCSTAIATRYSARPCASPEPGRRRGRPADRFPAPPGPSGDVEAAPLPAAYFRRAAVNAAVDLLRRRAVHAESVYDDRAPHAAVEPPSLLKEQLRRAIATLDSEDATLFLLRHVEGCQSTSWPGCSSSRRTTWPSGSTGSGIGCRRRWSGRRRPQWRSTTGRGWPRCFPCARSEDERRSREDTWKHLGQDRARDVAIEGGRRCRKIGWNEHCRK